MHWTIRMMVAAACLASLTWTAEVTGNDLETEIDTVQYDDAIDPAERIISVGNVEGLGVFLVQLSTLTALSLAAVYSVYIVLLPSVASRSLSWSPWDVLGQVGETVDGSQLLRRVLDSIDSINTRMQSEDRAVCRKLSLCQMGSVTSGFTLIHTFFQILRPVFPEIDDSWEGLMAGEARQDCNTLYPECPKAILRAVFGNIN